MSIKRNLSITNTLLLQSSYLKSHLYVHYLVFPFYFFPTCYNMSSLHCLQFSQEVALIYIKSTLMPSCHFLFPVSSFGADILVLCPLATLQTTGRPHCAHEHATIRGFEKSPDLWYIKFSDRKSADAMCYVLQYINHLSCLFVVFYFFFPDTFWPYIEASVYFTTPKSVVFYCWEVGRFDKFLLSLKFYISENLY